MLFHRVLTSTRLSAKRWRKLAPTARRVVAKTSGYLTWPCRSADWTRRWRVNVIRENPSRHSLGKRKAFIRKACHSNCSSTRTPVHLRLRNMVMEGERSLRDNTLFLHQTEHWRNRGGKWAVSEYRSCCFQRTGAGGTAEGGSSVGADVQFQFLVGENWHSACYVVAVRRMLGPKAPITSGLTNNML